jgi:DeoR family transcriptional regulator, suf operon transcriptional repressor
MDSISPGLAGQKGLKGEILLSLKKAQPLTTKELAEIFGVTGNAIRRHLKELEAEGLVQYGREQRGTGAPTFAYRLSRSGEALFPRRYEEALTRLLKHVMESEGREAAVAVLKEQYFDLRKKLGAGFDEMAAPERVKAVAEVLEDAGFMAEYDESGGEMRLTIHNCALHAAASCLPEVCETELTFLENLIAAHAERRTHIMDGCNTCQYVIRSKSAPEPVA